MPFRVKLMQQLADFVRMEHQPRNSAGKQVPVPLHVRVQRDNKNPTWQVETQAEVMKKL